MKDSIQISFCCRYKCKENFIFFKKYAKVSKQKTKIRCSPAYKTEGNINYRNVFLRNFDIQDLIFDIRYCCFIYYKEQSDYGKKTGK
jgi:hypothetical protein